MPFLECMLLTLLGTAPVAPTRGTPSGRTFPPCTITQPAGAVAGDLDLNAGIALVEQDTAGCHGRKVGGTGKKPPRHLASRRYPRKVTGRNTNAGVKPNMNQQPRPPRPRAAPSNSNKNSK